MKVSAIVVTYNRVNLLQECINDLLKQSYTLDHIFIINNNSTDGTSNYLSKLTDPRIVTINTGKNLGGAGGFSLGTKLAFEHSDSDYFWLMDDDTMVTQNALMELIKFTKLLDGKFGYLSSNVRWWKNNAPSYRNIPCASNDWTDLINKGLVKLNFASFVALFVPRTVVKREGLPILDMFIWGDDVEYTTRISRDYKSYFIPNSVVLHKSGSNPRDDSIFTAPNNHRLVYYKYMFRNRLFIARKYFSFKHILAKLLLYTSILFEIPFRAKDARVKRICYTLSGILKGLIFSPKVRFPKDN